MTRFYGSFWPFTVKKAERDLKDDPRPSLEERYGTKAIYVEKVILETKKLLKDRLLIMEDADGIIESAKAISWPPVMLENQPFWE